MPTSIPWRSSARSLTLIEVEVPRPSGHDVERLSPEPALPSYGSNLESQSSNLQHVNDRNLFGLGLDLSTTSNSNEDFHTLQPDHIYIDQNGGAHISTKERNTSRHTHHQDTTLRNRRKSDARSTKQNSKQVKSRGHTRSGSTIDDLANIAIATSPTFAGESPTFSYNGNYSGSMFPRPVTSYIERYESENNNRYGERPAKRVRSEKLHPMEWSPRDERPRTSHALQTQSSMEDAELLLGLRLGYSFSTNTSPVFVPAVTSQQTTTTDLIQPPAQEDSPHRQDFEQPEAGEKPIQQELHAEVEKDSAAQVEEQIQADQMDIDHAPEPPQIPQSATVTETQAEPEKPAIPPTPDTPDTIAQPTLPTANEEPKLVQTTKKPRKIKPEIQAEVCASCQKLQRDDRDEDTTTQWIGCEYCKKWFHLACQGFKDKSEARSVDKFVCKDCEPQHGQTTFVRKSSRVRTAIDYAGLNQGVVKSSEETSMHHYIQPIKDGRIKYQPDDFARIRPELLTAEFWENMDNMKRPFVVPACWNPRFGIPGDAEESKADALDAPPIVEPSFITYDAHGNIVHDTPETPASNKDSPTITRETVMECDQDYLDMVMPRHLTVRKVSELYGSEQPVPVIDVKSQETKGQWTLNDWADYYEQSGHKPVRNVISLEVSNSPIGKLIRRPRAVRDIDLEDDVWDNETRTTSNKRPVQFYCLMSVADSYTDFHIDFGGSSVYYHILKGVKTFFFIPPEEKYLKEYEKWCNSEAQNDTWLGDLCNGNVTRVDLHEGDTAFIPAGWIHSVWTPEDSLVIGGNFLTRLDYELQLKVAHIEKTTKVPQKFRYPFFQKVMWYTLLKYLDEDPVPEEVLREFHADEEYRFLRANPIWLEYGELADNAEPGEPGYNARIYPKSELKGLPHLRDYLYRTACIHADIPVPDINKKQIDAVKASIPKGHGDPMRLIKTFAVWCAWKLGNETVPKWVHDQGDGLVTEIKEREKAKEEVFRVPPERVSARNASKLKAGSPASVVDVSESSSAKSKNGSRGGSLRVACDACRKRRIKCRHKEGDENAVNASPPEIRPRTYSNISVDIPKLTSASPANPTFDQSPTTSGVAHDANTSDLAQAALASLQTQTSDPGQMVGSTTPGGSAKKGRSKACEECRKSKRRCVHDEYGRIDPAKAAEPSKPRGSANSKRSSRPSDENPLKRYKTDSDDASLIFDVANSSDIDMMIDPALMDDGFSITAIHPPTETLVTQTETGSDAVETAGPPLATPTQEDCPTIDTHMTANAESVLPDTSDEQVKKENVPEHLDDTLIQDGPLLSAIVSQMRQSPDVDISYSPITVDGTVTDSGQESSIKLEDVDTDMLGSRRSSRQPTQTEVNTKDEHQSPTKVMTGPSREGRGSSSSERTLETTGKSRRSSSNTSGTTHHAVVVMHNDIEPFQEPLVSRDSVSDSDMGADEKFARELQAAENGLRRRASMRA